MARGIASLIVVLDPEKIILSGGMSKAEGIAGTGSEDTAMASVAYEGSSQQ